MYEKNNIMCDKCIGTWSYPVWSCYGRSAGTCNMCIVGSACCCGEQVCPNMIVCAPCFVITAALFPLHAIMDVLCCPIGCCCSNNRDCYKYKGSIPVTGC